MIHALVTAGIMFLAAPSPSPAPGASPSPRTVAGSLSVFGGSLQVPPDEVRQGDVTIYGGSVDVQGRITHNLRVFGGSVTVDGSVGHDIVMFGGAVHLGPTAVVGHDVRIVGGSVDRDPAARVGGEVVDSGGGFNTDVLTALLPGLPQVPSPGGFDLAFGITAAVGLFLLALVVQLFFPRQVALTSDALEDRPLVSLGFGCLTAVAGALLALLLGVTVVLLPVSFAIAGVMAAGWLLGLTGVILLLGQRLAGAVNLRPQPVPALVIGGVLVAVLVNIPYLGVVFGLLIGSMALGAVVLTRFGTRAHPPATPPLVPPMEVPR